MRTHRLLVIRMMLAGCCLALAACQQHSAELSAGYGDLDRKEYEQALTAADRYLRENPAGSGVAEANYLRGRALEQRPKRNNQQVIADLREAQAAYAQAIDLNPPVQLAGYILTSLGNTSFWLDDYATAEAQWSRAYEKIDRDDLKGWVLYRIGLCQQRQGRWSAADSTFAAVQQRFPASDAAARAAAHQGATAYYVQVAAFMNPASAERLVTTLRSQRLPALRLPKPQKNLHLVMVGPLSDYHRALDMQSRVVGQGFKDALIVP